MRTSLAVVAVLAAAGALAVATAGAPFSDQLEDSDITLENASGPDGAYAAITDGTATIDFETSRATGVNPDATTVTESVLTLTDQGTQPVGVSLAGVSDVQTVGAEESLTGAVKDGEIAVVARLDAVLGVGESIDIDIAVVSATSDLLWTLTVTATAVEGGGGAGGGVLFPEDGLVARYPFDDQTGRTPKICCPDELVSVVVNTGRGVRTSELAYDSERVWIDSLDDSVEVAVETQDSVDVVAPA